MIKNLFSFIWDMTCWNRLRWKNQWNAESFQSIHKISACCVLNERKQISAQIYNFIIFEKRLYLESYDRINLLYSYLFCTLLFLIDEAGAYAIFKEFWITHSFSFDSKPKFIVPIFYSWHLLNICWGMFHLTMMFWGAE